MTYSSFRPGQEWLDTGGRPIHIHGGSVLRVGSAWYWYGEDKADAGPVAGVWHSGVRAYESTDLYNWRDLGHILPARTDQPGHPLHPATMMDRPHIVFNRRTQRFLCWLKVMRFDGTQETWVYSSEEFTGPYEVIRSGFRPLGFDAGDFDLVIDPVSGRGTYIFEKVHSELICADLDDEYTGVTDRWSTHFPHPHPPEVREAPAHFSHNGRHFLFTSGTSWYFPNQSEVAVADDLHGPWQVLGNPHPGDPSGTSFHSQISSVLAVAGAGFIAIADRWLPDASDSDIRSGWEATRAQFSGDGGGDGDREVGDTYPNTSRARHVWLPVRFEHGVPRIDWHDEWTLDDLGS